MIELIDIEKDYFIGNTCLPILKNINLHIKKNDFTAILGASGSGKSTLMNILGCLDTPTKGTYLLENEDVSKLSSNQRAEIRNKKIGFVFQSFNLLPKLTALQNVEVPLLYANEPDYRKKSADALNKVGLKDRMHHYPNQLSGGQCQRVAIARALINNPAIILADEPTGNLDSKTSAEILELFFHLHKHQGTTIIIVTHEKEIAEKCYKQILIKDGIIIKEI